MSITTSPTTMATSTPPIEDSASSTLSSAPATAILDRAKLEIGLQIRLKEVQFDGAAKSFRGINCSCLVFYLPEEQSDTYILHKRRPFV